MREKMICHAIVGNNTGKEKIMKVDVIADFIEPLVQFSERKISFFVLKVYMTVVYFNSNLLYCFLKNIPIVLESPVFHSVILNKPLIQIHCRDRQYI